MLSESELTFLQIDSASFVVKPISQTSSDNLKSLEAQQIKPIKIQQSPPTVIPLNDKDRTRAREEKRRRKQIMTSCTKPCGLALSNAFSALGSLEEEG